MTLKGDKFEGDFESGYIGTLEDLKDLIKEWTPFEGEYSEGEKIIEVSFPSKYFEEDSIEGITITVSPDIPEDYMKFITNKGRVEEFCV